MASDFCSATRFEKGRIDVLCNLFRAAVDGQKDQPVGDIFCRESPKHLFKTRQADSSLGNPPRPLMYGRTISSFRYDRKEINRYRNEMEGKGGAKISPYVAGGGAGNDYKLLAEQTVKPFFRAGRRALRAIGLALPQPKIVLVHGPIFPPKATWLVLLPKMSPVVCPCGTCSGRYEQGGEGSTRCPRAKSSLSLSAGEVLFCSWHPPFSIVNIGWLIQ